MRFPDFPKYTSVKAYYLGAESFSGLRDIDIGEGIGQLGALDIPGLERFFLNMNRIACHPCVVPNNNTTTEDPSTATSLKYIVYYDQKLHDQRSEKCPYLFVRLGEEDVPCDMTGSERVGGILNVVRHIPSITRHPFGLYHKIVAGRSGRRR